MAEAIRDRLSRGITALGLNLDPARQQQLCDYLDLLARWNAAYNLTAVRDPVAMVSRHLLDSLAIAPHLSGARILDVGTGAGLPGIPLAVAFPNRHIDLLDGNGKKTRFLFQVKTQLGLTNIGVIEARAEQYQPTAGYDAITTRALADLGATCRLCRHLLAPGGFVFAMKAASATEEITQIETPFELHSVIELVVPGLDEQRSLVVLRREH